MSIAQNVYIPELLSVLIVQPGGLFQLCKLSSSFQDLNPSHVWNSSLSQSHPDLFILLLAAETFAVQALSCGFLPPLCLFLTLCGIS